MLASIDFLQKYHDGPLDHAFVNHTFEGSNFIFFYNAAQRYIAHNVSQIILHVKAIEKDNLTFRDTLTY